MSANTSNISGGKPLVAFPILEAAAGGNVDAINKVLKHFEGYIIVLSAMRLQDEDGREYFAVDEEKRRTLETGLITKILQFNAQTQFSTA